MSFYELLCKHYDEIFPATAEGMRFVNTLLGEGGTILDLGCGTGNKTMFLAEGRKKVIAVDADPDMIDYARKHHAADNVTYLGMHMEELDEELIPDSFDAASCLGNTLPHLTGEGALLGVFRQVKKVLKRDGRFVGQLLNYERIISQRITELPLVETENVVFRRTYEWDGGVMHFREELTDKRTGEVQTDSIPLRPLLKGEVEDTLSMAGFGPVEIWGGLDGQPYTSDSYHVVFRAAANLR